MERSKHVGRIGTLKFPSNLRKILFSFYFFGHLVLNVFLSYVTLIESYFPVPCHLSPDIRQSEITNTCNDETLSRISVIEEAKRSVNSS